MIVVTDSDGKAISGLRLRPDQEVEINITTEAATGLYVLVQATRADFITEEQNGESESVARGNGQELIDDGLIEIKLPNEDWKSLAEPVELEFLTVATPQQIKVRVSSVGAAVGEVAFGLGFMYADLGEWTVPLGAVVKINGYDGQLFYPFGPYYVGYPVDSTPYVEGPVSAYFEDYQVFFVEEDYYLPISYIEFYDDKQQLSVSSKWPGTPILMNKFIDKGLWFREVPEPEPSNLDDTLLMLMLGGMGGINTVELSPVQGEDWTHEANLGQSLNERIRVQYNDGQWELLAVVYEEPDEESEVIATAAGTNDKIPVLWTMTDVLFEGQKLTIIKKEEE